MERKNKDFWSFGRNDDDSDKSSGNETPFSTRSSSSSSESSSDSSDEKAQSSEMETLSIQEGSYDIISKSHLQQFVQKIDGNSSLDDQGSDMMAKIADSFADDVSMRMVKLAQFRKSRVSLLDLKFILKREYNMEFPNE
ncbi:suppressor protein SRP40 [Drosophila subpulchrella]|uniref:suppressor protein SRP40 n=1 Tax=Drosophila subpulchrella TaxID=1486046 RepID=UPI0018A1526F|nr:suppressor protein SRP40 [Drosophila subpulchrella]